MPRKVKKAKVKKSTIKTKRQRLGTTEPMEKALQDIPNQLQAEASKDLSILKKQEAKLQAALQKMQKQQKAIKSKHVVLSTKAKTNLTAPLKKRLKAVNKAYDLINQGIADITKQIDHTKNQGDQVSQKQAKYLALSKQLIQFNKEWDKKSVKVKADKPIAKNSKKPVKKARISIPSEQTTLQEPMKIDSTSETTAEVNS
jgi:hypothetical protein